MRGLPLQQEIKAQTSFLYLLYACLEENGEANCVAVRLDGQGDGLPDPPDGVGGKANVSGRVKFRRCFQDACGVEGGRRGREGGSE